MMKRIHVLSLVAAAAMAVSSCSIYHPQAVDIPLINHPDDVRVDASLGLSTWVIPDVFTLNATASYGFNDWLAGQAHFNYGGDNLYAQLAPGAYFPLSENAVVETYVGLGLGGAWRDNISSSHANENDTTTFHQYGYSGNFFLPFAQANIGWHDLTAAHIDLAFGLKLGAYLPDFDYKKYDDNGNLIAGSDQTYNTANFLVEPQFLFRIGGERMKFNVKVGFNWLSDIFGSDSYSGPFTADLFTISTGFTFSL
ncbi:MAG: hypothetical protein II849_00035 [Bacteroidales bacterium]|nr:hypothetical protein [Bacteroidales bacterium]